MSDNVTPLNPPIHFLRMEEVEKRIGLKKSKIYLMIKAKAFPEPVSLGSKAVAWVSSEIEEWQNKRIQERAMQ